MQCRIQEFDKWGAWVVVIDILIGDDMNIKEIDCMKCMCKVSFHRRYTKKA